MSRSKGGRPDRIKGVILVASEFETELGGRETAWVDSGVVWFAVDTRGLREREDREIGQPRLVETARVAARTHPLVRRGVRLSTRDGDWAVTAVEEDSPGPGRSILHIRRV